MKYILPEDLANALQDSVHKNVGHHRTTRAAKSNMNNGNDLEKAVELVLEAGLATGHAESFVELMEEVLGQYEELRAGDAQVVFIPNLWSDTFFKEER